MCEIILQYITCDPWQVFKEAIKAAVAYKEHSTDFLDDVMRELEVSKVFLMCYT